MTAILEDSFGNVETGDNSSSVAISIASGTGSFTASSTTSVTVASGVATFSNLAMNAGGTFTLKVSDASTTAVPSAAPSSSFFVISVTSASVVSDKNGVESNFVLFNNGTVYQQTGTTSTSLTLTEVTGGPVNALSGGVDTSGNADVTVLFAPGTTEANAGFPLETHTGTNETSGWVSLAHSVIASEASRGVTIRSFVTGGASSPALYGVVDVVFTDNTLWQINLGSPNAATEITSNVNFVALGVHGTGTSAVEALYVVFQDNGSTNGGVWQRSGPVSSGTWVPVTSLDVYAISASKYLSDTADLIVSNRNNSGIIDHSDWAWRGTPNSLTVVAGVAVSSIAIDAAGNDFYILQSTGSLYEHARVENRDHDNDRHHHWFVAVAEPGVDGVSHRSLLRHGGHPVRQRHAHAGDGSQHRGGQPEDDRDLMLRRAGDAASARPPPHGLTSVAGSPFAGQGPTPGRPFRSAAPPPPKGGFNAQREPRTGRRRRCSDSKGEVDDRSGQAWRRQPLGSRVLPEPERSSHATSDRTGLPALVLRTPDRAQEKGGGREGVWYLGPRLGGNHGEGVPGPGRLADLISPRAGR